MSECVSLWVKKGEGFSSQESWRGIAALEWSTPEWLKRRALNHLVRGGAAESESSPHTISVVVILQWQPEQTRPLRAIRCGWVAGRPGVCWRKKFSVRNQQYLHLSICSPTALTTVNLLESNDKKENINSFRKNFPVGEIKKKILRQKKKKKKNLMSSTDCFRKKRIMQFNKRRWSLVDPGHFTDPKPEERRRCRRPQAGFSFDF